MKALGSWLSEIILQWEECVDNDLFCDFATGEYGVESKQCDAFSNGDLVYILASNVFFSFLVFYFFSNPGSYFFWSSVNEAHEAWHHP